MRAAAAAVAARTLVLMAQVVLAVAATLDLVPPRLATGSLEPMVWAVVVAAEMVSCPL
jgi:hypothetical protein